MALRLWLLDSLLNAAMQEPPALGPPGGRSGSKFSPWTHEQLARWLDAGAEKHSEKSQVLSESAAVHQKGGLGLNSLAASPST
mmetsp:Transcript_112391/g.305106  ORF Transcript_112391/g.305106 Transcript_112391/m.305106 type:complete len:83 (-) Transcript_112391:415-663(-)